MPTTQSDGTISRLRREVIDVLKQRFVGRDEVIDLIALALVAGEHLFLYGPPGTAKSALIRQFAGCVHGVYFEYLLTRFSEPNEIFGPIDLARLREGTVATVTTGMLPEAEFVFLDELFNANSAILNNLLTVLNERIYRRGAESHRLPLLSLFSASNHLPEDDSLRALFDRFLLRVQVDNLKADALPQLLTAGWALEHAATVESTVSADDLRALSASMYLVDVTTIATLYAEVIGKVRDLGVAISDRRAVKILKLLAASAVLCGRTSLIVSDLWVLRYVWDREEQIGPLAGLIHGIIEAAGEEQPAHPRASTGQQVDGEDLAKQLESIGAQLNGPRPTLSVLARLRERLTDIADQAAWLREPHSRAVLQKRVSELVAKIG